MSCPYCGGDSILNRGLISVDDRGDFAVTLFFDIQCDECGGEFTECLEFDDTGMSADSWYELDADGKKIG